MIGGVSSAAYAPVQFLGYPSQHEARLAGVARALVSAQRSPANVLLPHPCLPSVSPRGRGHDGCAEALESVPYLRLC